MKKLHRVSLRAFNTMGTESVAAQLWQLESQSDVQALEGLRLRNGHDLVLGGGSNLLFASDVPGTVYLNRIRGHRVVRADGARPLVEAAAGESWHEFVRWTLDQGLSGIENLSLIPGLVGAAPIQNIGAYGVELSSVLESVEAFDWERGERVRIPAEECAFAYRDSRFKSREPDRFLIVSCRLRLRRDFEPVLEYAGLRDELADMGVTAPTAHAVSDAVIRLRQRKLPNPEHIGNAGSFFKNPRLDEADAQALAARFPGLPVHSAGAGQRSLSAAWMIEHCGWKGYRDGDAGVSEQHALVLVNHGTARGQEILALAARIAQSVQERFGLRLEREPAVFEAG